MTYLWNNLADFKRVGKFVVNKWIVRCLADPYMEQM